jgi:hypothetical protein
MTSKTFKISPNSGLRVEPIEIEGQKMISIRQVYKTQKEPDEWKPGYKFITVPAKGAAKLGAYLQELMVTEDLEFTHIEPKTKAEPKSKKGKK